MARDRPGCQGTPARLAMGIVMVEESCLSSVSRFSPPFPSLSPRLNSSSYNPASLRSLPSVDSANDSLLLSVCIVIHSLSSVRPFDADRDLNPVFYLLDYRLTIPRCTQQHGLLLAVKHHGAQAKKEKAPDISQTW